MPMFLRALTQVFAAIVFVACSDNPPSPNSRAGSFKVRQVELVRLAVLEGKLGHGDVTESAVVSSLNRILATQLNAGDDLELRLETGGQIGFYGLKKNASLNAEAMSILTSGRSIFLCVELRDHEAEAIVPSRHVVSMPDLPISYGGDRAERFKKDWSQTVAERDMARKLVGLQTFRRFLGEGALQGKRVDAEFRTFRVCDLQKIEVSSAPDLGSKQGLNLKVWFQNEALQDWLSFVRNNSERTGFWVTFRGFTIGSSLFLQHRGMNRFGIRVEIDGVRDIQFLGAMRVMALGIDLAVVE